MTKHEDVTKQGLCKKLGHLWENLLLFCTYSISISISLSLKSISEFSGAICAMSGIVTSANRLVAQKADTAYLRLSGRGRRVRWVGCLFEAAHVVTFSAFRMGAYSRWAVIRGWALIRINRAPYFLHYSFIK